VASFVFDHVKQRFMEKATAGICDGCGVEFEEGDLPGPELEFIVDQVLGAVKMLCEDCVTEVRRADVANRRR